MKKKTTKQLQAQAEYEKRKRDREYRLLKRLNRKAESKRYSKEAYKRRQEYKAKNKIKGALPVLTFDIKPKKSLINKNPKTCFNCNGWINGRAFNVMSEKDITGYFNGSGITGLIKHLLDNTITNKEAKGEELDQNIFYSEYTRERDLFNYTKKVEEQFKDWKEAPKLWIPITIKINTEDKEIAQEYFNQIDLIFKNYGYESIASAEHYNEYHKDKKHKGQAHKHYIFKNFTEDKTGKISYGLKEKKLDRHNLRTIRQSIDNLTKEFCKKYNLPYNTLPTQVKNRSKAGYRTYKGDLDYTREKTGQNTGGQPKTKTETKIVYSTGLKGDNGKELTPNQVIKFIQEKDKLIKQLQANQKTKEDIDKINFYDKELKKSYEKNNNPDNRGIRWGEINSLTPEQKLKLKDKEGINIFIEGQQLIKNPDGTTSIVNKIAFNKESKVAQQRIEELAKIRELKQQGREEEAREIEKNSRTKGIVR